MKGLIRKAVEELVDEAQTVLRTLSIDATNGYEKDAIENPTAAIPFPEQKRTTDHGRKTEIKLSSYQGFKTKMNSTCKA